MKKRKLTSFLRQAKTAVRKVKLQYQLTIAEQSYKGEKLNAKQAEANAQFFKLRAGQIKYKLEDLENAPE